MSRFPDELLRSAEALLERAKMAGVTIATVESCTGGLVAGLLTEIAGSSATIHGGFVTYSNEAKETMVSVPPALLAAHGAVSAAVAAAMAEGGLARTGAGLAVAITGIAGPGGGSAAKPVGLVCFACARRDGTTLHREERFGDIGREAVRTASVATALALLAEALDASQPAP